LIYAEHEPLNVNGLPLCAYLVEDDVPDSSLKLKKVLSTRIVGCSTSMDYELDSTGRYHGGTSHPDSIFGTVANSFDQDIPVLLCGCSRPRLDSDLGDFKVEGPATMS
jgi:hypothetical protein